MAVHLQPVEGAINENGCLHFLKDYMPYSFQGDIGLYMDEENFKSFYGNVDGQITRTSLFGHIITTIASDPTGPTLWLDIGTWNGRGTTSCILDGFYMANCIPMSKKEKDSQKEKKCLTVELHPFMYNIAQENLKGHPAFSQIQFAQAKISGPGGEAHIMHPPKGETCMHYKLHYETDMALWKAAETLVFPFEPEAVILDGGEYTGYADWFFLPKGSLKYVFLDDSAITKNAKVRQELLESSEWTLLQENLKDRNGWSVFTKNT